MITKVVYHPLLKAHHIREITPIYSKYRDRTEGYSLMSRKWNIDQVVILGKYTQNLISPFDKILFECEIFKTSRTQIDRYKKLINIVRKTPILGSLARILFKYLI